MNEIWLRETYYWYTKRRDDSRRPNLLSTGERSDSDIARIRDVIDRHVMPTTILLKCKQLEVGRKRDKTINARLKVYTKRPVINYVDLKV